MCSGCVGVSGLTEPVDLVFMVDASTSLFSSGFEKEQNFINQVVQKVGPVSAPGLRVGVVVYSEFASIRIYLDDYFDNGAFRQAVNELIYDKRGMTRIDLGLRESIKLFTVESGARESSKKV